MVVALAMTHSIASDWGHGSHTPSTPARERLAAEDERTSIELAQRLNLKSARGGASPTPAFCLCGCGLPVPKTRRSGYATELCYKRTEMRRIRRRAKGGA